MPWFDGFQEQTVATSGTEIHLITGGSGPPLLLLHGYPQTHLMWRHLAPKLAERFTVVAPDLRGYGESGKPVTDAEHEIIMQAATELRQLFRQFGDEAEKLGMFEVQKRVAREQPRARNRQVPEQILVHPRLVDAQRELLDFLGLVTIIKHHARRFLEPARTRIGEPIQLLDPRPVIEMKMGHGIARRTARALLLDQIMGNQPQDRHL